MNFQYETERLNISDQLSSDFKPEKRWNFTKITALLLAKNMMATNRKEFLYPALPESLCSANIR